MIKYLLEDSWSIIEDGFHPEYQRSSESLFSIGNGRFGQRANFEEHYSGDSLQGSYVAGVYYPDKTRVGWWKNGYPEYFAKVLNSVNWIGIDVKVNGERLDLKVQKVHAFRRELDMKRGLLKRSCSVEMNDGTRVHIESLRLCHMGNEALALVDFSLRLDASSAAAQLEVDAYLDGDVRNEDANWEETFWEAVKTLEGSQDEPMLVQQVTKKTKFHVAAACCTRFEVDGYEHPFSAHADAEKMRSSHRCSLRLEEGQLLTLTKYVALDSSLNHAEQNLAEAVKAEAVKAIKLGKETLVSSHCAAWESIWNDADIRIEGDVAAQQGIRFNIFHLNQTYTGKDERLNIGPKGFTGEKYGGSTYWDTEAYCLPFYLNTHDKGVARQLLVYRYHQLDKAIENAEKLGFTNGAALYPMVTMNGEECHNEWEITFEEIHRNGAIAYGIFNYIRHTGDEAYMAEYGFDVLLGIARFWAQRVNWSEHRKAWVMLGVTGPNEYENNVNNNWYTNYIARWCLTYTLKAVAWIKENAPETYREKVQKWSFNEQEETTHWISVIEQMYFPKKEDSRVVLQQDGFLDKELHTVDDLPDSERPINQKWSWDRILRSVFIKQADVLQGFYFFEDDFDRATHEENFDFYEPRTVHESSLSPCVHVVLAAKLGRMQKAYELYLRTARLDLDDYNHEAYQGLHITSMAGTWLAVVEGFGGLRVRKGELQLNPALPDAWEAYHFKLNFRGRRLAVHVHRGGTEVKLESGEGMRIRVHGEERQL